MVKINKKTLLLLTVATSISLNPCLNAGYREWYNIATNKTKEICSTVKDQVLSKSKTLFNFIKDNGAKGIEICKKNNTNKGITVATIIGLAVGGYYLAKYYNNKNKHRSRP